MKENGYRPSFENYEAEGITPPDLYAELDGIMQDQIDFETTRVGTDGSLADHNSLPFILTRGIIGESLEAYLAETTQEQKEELCDILIFLASAFNHAGMTAEEVRNIAQEKMKKNYGKYAEEHFKGKTVKEGIVYSRIIHNNGIKK